MAGLHGVLIKIHNLNLPIISVNCIDLLGPSGTVKKEYTHMYNKLKTINSRPKPFEFYTADKLWADNHTSKKMLEFHLNESIDVSSRNKDFIGRSVDWVVSHFQVRRNTSIVDFGCGPGLYITLLAEKGADVTGIDFSERSIRYAKEIAVQKELDIHYLVQNYLQYETVKKFDLITIIMCDFCALSPAQRKQMLQKVHALLEPKASLLLDAYSLNAFEERKETATYEENQMSGFLNTFQYEKEKVILDKFTIVGASKTKTIYNWLQYFSLESIKNEFLENGFRTDECYSDLAGTPFSPDSNEFAIAAHKNG